MRMIFGAIAMNNRDAIMNTNTHDFLLFCARMNCCIVRAVSPSLRKSCKYFECSKCIQLFLEEENKIDFGKESVKHG